MGLESFGITQATLEKRIPQRQLKSATLPGLDQMAGRWRKGRKFEAVGPLGLGTITASRLFALFPPRACSLGPEIVD